VGSPLEESRITESFDSVIGYAEAFGKTLRKGNPISMEEAVYDLSAETEKLIFLLEISRGVPFVGSYSVYPEIPQLKEPAAFATFLEDTLKRAKEFYDGKHFRRTLEEILRVRASLVRLYTKRKSKASKSKAS